MLRSSSPAMSEISVGSPSPPPRSALANGFHILNIKRLKTNNDVPAQNVQFPQPLALPQRRKSSNERVKSFSIADILGNKKEDESHTNDSKSLPSKIATKPPLMPSPSLNPPSLVPNIPSTHLLAERLQPSHPTPLIMLDLPSLHKVIPSNWDPSSHLNSNPNVNPSNLSIHPFFPPALLHYEQRLAWDYQRQLQEHFQAQAQLLRQMSMDPNIIPSEDGSERSRSSSAGSQCYSPEVNVAEDDDDDEEDESEARCGKSASNLSKSEKCVKSSNSAKSSDTPLDALFQLSTKNFDEDQDPATLNIFATRPNPKKKRKSRTAFTNHQIFELEKRFLYQKYLSPADRDEIAGGLGLSNAQVITWFQNRRAKLKRDMEELKKDVESVKQLSAHKSFLENVNDLSILKTRPVSRYQPPPPTTTSSSAQQQHAEVHSAAITHGNHITGHNTPAFTGGLSEIIQQKNAATAAAQLPHHHPHDHITTTTTNTCNERREDYNNSSSINTTGSQAESGQPQQLRQHQQQQQPRNLQINNSRG